MPSQKISTGFPLQLWAPVFFFKQSLSARKIISGKAEIQRKTRRKFPAKNTFIMAH